MAVLKTLDLVGVSTESWREAAQQALDVLETTATVEDNQIKEYHTHVRIRFRIERA
jgi:flavin-binding protein dodecin